MAATRRIGIGLDEICDEFGVSHRTAQRMTDALETVFANVEAIDGEDRRRRWRIVDPALGRLLLRQETAIEALEIASVAARSDGRVRHAAALDDLRDEVLARLRPKDALRAEADVEAALLAMGSVTRPGPRVNLAPAVLDAVIEGLRGPFRLRLRYGTEDAPERIIEPHGFLLGHRSYLVVRQPDRGDGMRNFRTDRILSAQTLDESFSFAPGFSLLEYAARSFGVYQDPKQYGEVVWRFAPHAAGWLEMAWLLYQWGDAVEVVAPEGLRKLVAHNRRVDFDAFP